MARISANELSEELKKAILGLKKEEGLERSGVVTKVGDGIVWIYGLREAGYNEIIRIYKEKSFTKENCLKKAKTFDVNEKFEEYIGLYKVK